MSPEQIKAVIAAAIPSTHLDVASDGSHVHLTVVSEAFQGLSPVKKQQLVYAALGDAIASGAIHAVHMKTLTPAEWAATSA